MIKVKEVKNFANENIYFKTHASVVYRNDGSTVEDAINSIPKVETVTVTVTGIKSGFLIKVLQEDGTIISTQTELIKSHTIEEGVKYYIVAGTVEGYENPEPTEIFTAKKYFGRGILLNYKLQIITTIRINQTIQDPSTMITRIVDEGGIEAIRENSHRYTGTFNSATNVMTLKQLDDNDGTKYVDGSVADLTTIGTDVWMKLPLFYWKCEEYATDIWDFSVAYGAKPDDTWKEWDGKDLIGVYKAHSSGSKLFSASSYGYINYTNLPNLKIYAQNRGTGFSLVKWKHHCMMAMLFYTYYGSTNSLAYMGLGAQITLVPGSTNNLGMQDTNSNSSYVNFWGLENWWGNCSELVDNVSVLNGVFSITEDDQTVRTAGTQTFTRSGISKMLFGPNIDLIPTQATASSTTGFCDNSHCNSGGPYIMIRSGEYNSAVYGVASISTDVTAAKSGNYEYVSTRLAFRGDNIIIL